MKNIYLFFANQEKINSFVKNSKEMILSAFWPFYQYLWTVYFFAMFLAGFWCIFMFALYIVPLWLTEGLAEYFGKINRSFDPEKVRYQRLYEQEGVEVVYRKSSDSQSSNAQH